MSAWIVSKKHIDTMVAAALRGQFRIAQYSEADRVGAMLWEANHESVNSLYAARHGAEVCPRYRYSTLDAQGAATDPVVVLKAIDCYEYQSCEHDGWESSEARKFCEKLRRSVAAMLPGYDAAPWGID